MREKLDAPAGRDSLQEAAVDAQAPAAAPFLNVKPGEGERASDVRRGSRYAVAITGRAGLTHHPRRREWLVRVVGIHPGVDVHVRGRVPVLAVAGRNRAAG